MMRGRVVGALLAVAALSGCTDSSVGRDGTPPAQVAGVGTPNAGPAALADPNTVEMPPKVEGTAEWLAEDGAPLLAALRASAPLAQIDLDDPAPVCADVATALDDVADPLDLLALANEAPDGDGTILLANDLGAKIDLLGACTPSDEQLAALAEEVAFAHTVAVRWAEGYGADVT